jgi:serine/threonine protein kinase
MAPEQKSFPSKRSAPEVDIWTFGLLMASFIQGSDPSENGKQQFSIKDPGYEKFIDASDLVSQLLVEEPSDRIDIESALTHPLFWSNQGKAKVARGIRNRAIGESTKPDENLAMLLTFRKCRLPRRSTWKSFNFC